MSNPSQLLQTQAALQEMLELFDETRKRVQYGDNFFGKKTINRVRKLRELVRCSVVGCGNGGACNSEGTANYPCPMKDVP